MNESERKKLIQSAMEKIRKKHGGLLRPNDIVAEAKTKTKAISTDEFDALHSSFQWDDSLAASRYREQQARALISTYCIVTTVHQSKEYAAPIYVRNVTIEPNRQGYSNLEDLSRDEARSTLSAEVARCRSAIDRARAVVGVLDQKHPHLQLGGLLENMLRALVELESRLDEAA